MSEKTTSPRYTRAMLVIGLTGGIGAGKSTVTRMFANLGITIVDADAIAREVVAPNQPALQKIIEHFGAKILLQNGKLDRAALRDLIFQNANEKQWLEQLLHPLIRAQMEKRIHTAQSRYVICDIPLLLEADTINPLINRILVVDVPVEIQIERTQKRDQLTRDQILATINSQVTRQQRLSKADDVIDNTGTLDQLRARVTTLHEQYLALAQLNKN